MFNQSLDFSGSLGMVVTRRDGRTETLDGGKKIFSLEEFTERIIRSKPLLSRIYYKLRANKAVPVTLTLAAFILCVKQRQMEYLALVTTAGINLLAADFVSGAGTHIAAFNYHDCGTGTTAEAISQTALVTAAGTARVSGTQSTPTAGQYRTSAQVSYTGSLAITEWGLFTASTAGTLWDRRVFAAVNVGNGDSITFTYTLTCNAGGS